MSDAHNTSALAQLRQIDKPIDKYIFMRNLKTDSQNDFYRLLREHTLEVLPFLYTPTVGEACQKYHKLPLTSWGLFLNYEQDRGNILDKLRAWPQQEVHVVVVTDGEHILGLGDLGSGGMGISEGKILLYCGCTGLDPTKCLPMCLDVGTNNEELLRDPSYPGLKRERVRGEEYDAFLAEFVDALQQWQRHVVLQFEDFGNDNAFNLLETYKHKICCFNDDIQGTACVCLAALFASMRVTRTPLAQQRVLFFGAGKAGIGMADLIALAISQESGKPIEEARKHCFFMDSKGLICEERLDSLAPHKRPYAHDVPLQHDLLDAVHALKPTALVGVSTIPGSFTPDVIRAMCEHNERPLVFPLSNPTSKSECTFQDVLQHGGGKVLFASGSPFDPITGDDGVEHVPAQANNAYVFPAVGHAASLAEASSLPDDVFLDAARALSEIVSEEQISTGTLFPDFDAIQGVNKAMMARVRFGMQFNARSPQIGQFLEGRGLGKKPKNMDWDAVVENAIWRVPS